MSNVSTKCGEYRILFITHRIIMHTIGINLVEPVYKNAMVEFGLPYSMIDRSLISKLFRDENL